MTGQEKINELERKVIKLEEENKNLKTKNKELEKKNNKANAEKNYYKNKYNELNDNFYKIVKEKVDKEINKALEKCKRQHKLELMKKDQEIFKLNNIIKTNSKTSNLPSSKNPIYAPVEELKTNLICSSRKKSDKNVGGQPGHKKSKLEKFKDEEINEIIEHTTEKCPNCYSHNLELVGVRERDVTDIEIIVKKTRHKFYIYKCRDCGKIIKTTIPKWLHAENQYGPNLETFAYALTSVGYVSIKRASEIISGTTNNQINMSEGHIASLPKKIKDGVVEFNEEMYKRILNTPLLHWDDTNVKIGKLKHGCWRGYVTDKYAFFTAHETKSSKGMDEDNILQSLPSTCYVMHDHLIHNYCKEYKYINLECNAHITRKLEKISVAANQKWSRDMKKLLEETNYKRSENIRNKIYEFTKEEIEEFDQKYDQILKEGFEEYEEFKKHKTFSDEANLLKMMQDYKEPITMWVRNYNLPYSNNLVERSFRFLKSKMKISYQFKNIEHTRMFASITSYVETCNKFGLSKFDAIKSLFENNPYTFEDLEKLKPAT